MLYNVDQADALPHVRSHHTYNLVNIYLSEGKWKRRVHPSSPFSVRYHPLDAYDWLHC